MFCRSEVPSCDVGRRGVQGADDWEKEPAGGVYEAEPQFKSQPLYLHHQGAAGGRQGGSAHGQS